MNRAARLAEYDRVAAGAPYRPRVPRPSWRKVGKPYERGSASTQ